MGSGETASFGNGNQDVLAFGKPASGETASFGNGNQDVLAFGETALASTSCTECSNKPSPYMEEKGVKCSNSRGTLIKKNCKNNPIWEKENYCERRCQADGKGYPKSNCCEEQEQEKKKKKNKEEKEDAFGETAFGETAFGETAFGEPASFGNGNQDILAFGETP